MMVHIVVGGGAKEREKHSGTTNPSLLTIYSDDEPVEGDSSGKEMKLYSKDFMLDRNIYKRGKKPDKFRGQDLINRPLRNLFIDEEDSTIAKIIWEYFKAVELKWPNAWERVEQEMILNKSTGFLALTNLFKDIYVHVNKIGEVVEHQKYLKYFDKSSLKESDFTRSNFLPGSGGQSKLYKTLKEQMEL